VFVSAPAIVAEALDEQGSVVPDVLCDVSPAPIEPPTPTSTPVTVTVRCGADANPANDPEVRVTLHPLEVVPRSTAVTLTATELSTLAASGLVSATAGADCSFAPDAGPSRTGGLVTVRCTLEVDETTGVDETQVTLTVTPEVSAVSLALSTATPAQLQARVTQRSAGSCAVTCVGESPAPTVTAETAVVDEGAVSVAFPSLAPGTSTCTVSCGEPTDPAVFTVFAGDVLNAAALEALASLDAIAGRVAIDEQLTNRVLSSSASVIVGDLSIRDADNTANNVFLRFSNLVSLGGSLVLDSVDDLPSLQDLDQDERLDEDGVEGPDDFSFPLLTTIGGELKITGNPALLNAVFPRLTSIGTSLTVSGNGALSTLSLPELASIGTSLTVSGNGALSTLSLESLRIIGGDPTVDDFTIARNSPLLQCLAIELLLDGVYGSEPTQSACPAPFELTLEDAAGIPCSFTCD
jgi:hypothetical protein